MDTELTMLRHYKNQITGKVSTIYADACEGLDRLTLRRDFVCAPPKPAPFATQGKWFTDPFLEVTTVPPDEVRRVWDIGTRRTETAEDVADVVCETVADEWDSSKVHVVFCSSGWDSRIISGAIRRLYRECGDSWLGDILFLSNRWEADAFREIMKREGWKPGQYAAYDEGPIDEHYAVPLNFDIHWYACNAPVPMPGRKWWYLPAWARSKGLLPGLTETQTFHGLNQEAWRHWCKGPKRWIGGRTWLEYQNIEYYAETSIDSRDGTRGIAILAMKRLIEAVRGYVGPQQSGDRLRVDVANVLTPECRDIPNLHLDDHFAPISARLMAECNRMMSVSWYCGALGIDWQCPDTAELDPRWGQYSLASLCEHFIKNGAEIVIEGMA